MSIFTFELAFDWQVKPTALGVGRIFPLQMSLVENSSGQLISPASLSQIKPQTTLDFRIYDISRVPQQGIEPKSLQIVFNRAVEEDPPQPFFTPFGDPGQEVPELTFTGFSTPARPTIAYGQRSTGIQGWEVDGSEQMLENEGRFELRMAVTVAVLGQVAKYYFVDPEMIICSDETC